jgi:hypothetical protein
MALDINIEDRYRLAAKRERQMHHVWAATAAAVIGVGAAAAGTAISMDASKKAAGAQGAAAKKARRQEKKALKGFQQGQQQVEQAVADVPMPVYNPYGDIPVAEAFSASLLRQQEAAMPGAKAQRQGQLELVNQAMQVLSQGLRGEYGEDLKKNVMRDVAQFAGAGFNPATAGRAGGFQASQGFGAAQLGKTARDVQMESLAAIPGISNVALNWQQLANQFTVSPDVVSRTNLAYQMGAANVGLQKAGIQADLVASLYGAQTGQSQRNYQRNLDTAAANLNVGMQTARGVENIGSATAQVGTAYAGGVQQMRQNEMDQQYLDMLKGVYGGTQNV